MTEFKKEISIVAVVAVTAAIGLGLLAVVVFPRTSGISTTTTSSEQTPGLVPPVLIGLVSARDVACSLGTGVCVFTIVNNSTATLELESCKVVVNIPTGNGTSQSSLVNGTISGQAAQGIPANSHANASCTIQVSQLASQQPGSAFIGSYVVKLVDNWYNFPAGTESTIVFGGTWS